MTLCLHFKFQQNCVDLIIHWEGGNLCIFIKYSSEWMGEAGLCRLLPGDRRIFLEVQEDRERIWCWQLNCIIFTQRLPTSILLYRCSIIMQKSCVVSLENFTSYSTWNVICIILYIIHYNTNFERIFRANFHLHSLRQTTIMVMCWLRVCLLG